MSQKYQRLQFIFLILSGYYTQCIVGSNSRRNLTMFKNLRNTMTYVIEHTPQSDHSFYTVTL